jgi:hypothetical protein
VIWRLSGGGRRAVEVGELGKILGTLDCVQARRRESAGVGLRFKVLRPSTICSNHCRKQQGEASGKCAGEREERDNQWEEMGASHRVGIDRDVCRSGGIPTSNLVVLGRFEQGKKRGQREELGGFIDRGLDGYYCEITAGSKSPAFPVTERKRREFRGEEGADVRVPVAGGEGREMSGVGWFGADWAGWVPGVAQWLPFSFFFVLSPFLFSVFYFFHRFGILHPNKVKPISKLL